MKRVIIISASLVILFSVITAFKMINSNFSKDKHPTDMRDCLEKYKSKWGDPCTGCDKFRDTYTIYLKNVCEENIDVKIAVQNKNKTWRIIDKENIASGDTLVAFSCEGTGKFLKWVKKAGDREIVFPTNQEIFKQYPK